VRPPTVCDNPSCPSHVILKNAGMADRFHQELTVRQPAAVGTASRRGLSVQELSKKFRVHPRNMYLIGRAARFHTESCFSTWRCTDEVVTVCPDGRAYDRGGTGSRLKHWREGTFRFSMACMAEDVQSSVAGSTRRSCDATPHMRRVPEPTWDERRTADPSAGQAVPVCLEIQGGTTQIWPQSRTTRRHTGNASRPLVASENLLRLPICQFPDSPGTEGTTSLRHGPSNRAVHFAWKIRSPAIKSLPRSKHSRPHSRALLQGSSRGASPALSCRRVAVPVRMRPKRPTEGEK